MAADMYLDRYKGKVTVRFTDGNEYSWYTTRQYLEEVYDSLRTSTTLYMVEEQPIITGIVRRIINNPRIISVSYARITEQERLDYNKPVEPPTTP